MVLGWQYGEGSGTDRLRLIGMAPSRNASNGTLNESNAMFNVTNAQRKYWNTAYRHLIE